MSEPKTVISIGNFDGVHLGHRALLSRARSIAGDTGRVIAMSFDPHPAQVVRPDSAPVAIEPYPLRCERLKSAGADDVVTLDPRSGVLKLSPDEFISKIHAAHKPHTIVEGHDFRFGKSRAGNPDTLRSLGAIHGFEVEILGPVQAVLTNQHIVEVSSSMVRWCLKHGRVRDAAYLLGRSHELSGTVVKGQQLGRTIGVPTINIETLGLLPKNGVYSGYARVGEQRLLAAINIGTRPSVNGSETRTEAHLLEHDGSAWIPGKNLSEYGFSATLELVGWIRDEIRFSSIDALRSQIVRDTESVIETHGKISV